MSSLGRSYTDSRDASAIIQTDLQTLKNTDFVPLKEIAEIADFAMANHDSYLSIDNNPHISPRNLLTSLDKI
ncbi:MAG: hypothetical protein HON23_00160 [Rickettsiales bacterium]|nr:hypothetical protein [Rickettsiales bacterium]